MKEFRLTGVDSFICIRIDVVHGFPDRTSYLGGYDVQGYLELKNSGFEAHGNLWFSTGQLYLFYRDLSECYSKCSGEARFCSDENDFIVSVVFDKRGHVVMKGSYKTYYPDTNELNFTMQSDQSYFSDVNEHFQFLVSSYGDMKGLEV